MLPLIVAEEDKELVVKKISSNPETRLHIKNLGLIEGSIIKIVSKSGGNLIIQVKDTRLAISQEIAKKIYV